jgi:hypothetical protein
MPRNTFINPATGETYEWHRNHESEEASGKTRAISGQANTGQTGRVRQQSMAEPFALRLRGRIVHRAQFVAMWRWFELCESQTIYFRDSLGQEYEVQITAFNPRRVRKERSISLDPTIPLHFWEMDLEMTVYAFRDGDMAEAGVSP